MGKRQAADSKTSPIPAAGNESQIYDHLELLAVMGQDFSSSLDIEASLKRAIEHITKHLNAAGGALFLLDESGENLTCVACFGETEITGLKMKSDQGVIGRCVQNNVGEIVRDVSKDPNFYKLVDQETGFTTKSILCAPLSVREERLGAIEVINNLDGDGLFAPDDLNVLQAMSATAALAINNARQAEALVEQEKLARELELAAEIQRSLLPDPGDDDFPIAGVNHAAQTVSGDFFDFFVLDDDRICFNLGDVSGKGMNAALMMAKTASLYRCLGKTLRQPGRLMARINDEICETATRGMFVTMAGGIYDPKTGIVRLANAGHEPPLFHNTDGEFIDFPAEAPPLGVLPSMELNSEFPEIEIKLDGGTLYIFTDGVTEGYLEDGRELEVSGIKELIRKNQSLNINSRLDAVISMVNRGDGALRDDLTLLAINDAAGRAARVDGGKDTKSSKDKKDTGNEEAEVLLHLSVPSQPDRLKLVRNAVSETARFCGAGEDVIRDVVIAVNEACQNIIRHAYGGAPNGEIAIEIFRKDEDLVILLRDFAETIDVPAVKPRDLDDVRPGGLGTHFMREVMDEVLFMPPPSDGGNLLKMVKSLK